MLGAENGCLVIFRKRRDATMSGASICNELSFWRRRVNLKRIQKPTQISGLCVVWVQYNSTGGVLDLFLIQLDFHYEIGTIHNLTKWAINRPTSRMPLP